MCQDYLKSYVLVIIVRIDSSKKRKPVKDLEKHLETKEEELEKMNDKLKETEKELEHRNSLVDCFMDKEKLDEQILGYSINP